MQNMRLFVLLPALFLSCGRTKDSGQEQRPTASAEAKDASVDAQRIMARSPIKQISAGNEHICILLVDGRVRCWGNGDSGRLGGASAETIGDDEPASKGAFVELGGPVEQISAGDEHTCALLRTGGVRCWGKGENGRLGHGNTEDIGDNESPEVAGDVPLDEPALQVVAGVRHTCVLLASRTVRCWGDGSEFILGYGAEGPSYEDNVGDDEPVLSIPALRFQQKVQKIVIAFVTTCVLFEGGGVRCWGPVGRRGSAIYERPARLRSNVDLGAAAIALDAGTHYICAVTTERKLRCWGSVSIASALGYRGTSVVYGERINRYDPTPARLGDVPGITDVTQIAADDDHTCVLLGSGRIRCWGNARTGALGYGQAERWGGSSMVPREDGDIVWPKDSAELDLPAKVRQIAAGVFFTCALLEDETVRCWGWNEFGQLGYGHKNTVWTAATAPPVPL